jgi:hypothetical protein
MAQNVVDTDTAIGQRSKVESPESKVKVGS